MLESNPEFPSRWYIVEFDGFTQLDVGEGEKLLKKWRAARAAGDNPVLVFTDLHTATYHMEAESIAGVWLSTPESRASAVRFMKAMEDEAERDDDEW